MRRRHIAAAVIGLVITHALPASNAHADLTITITQVGPDVVATGSGTINLTALTLFGSELNVAPSMEPGEGELFEGALGTSLRDQYSGSSGPTSFGTSHFSSATSGTGDSFGVFGTAVAPIDVPHGYVSGAPLSATDIYSGQTISSLGLSPGTYTWTWGTGADADSLTVQIGTAAVVPEPSTAIVSVFGAFAFIAYGWSRHRREQRRQAAA